MAGGMALIVRAISLVSAAVFRASCAVTGAGTGIALMGAGRTVASSAHCNTAAG